MNKLNLIKKILLTIIKAIIALLYCLMMIGGGMFMILAGLIIFYDNNLNINTTLQSISIIISGGILGLLIDYLIGKLKLRNF